MSIFSATRNSLILVAVAVSAASCAKSTTLRSSAKSLAAIVETEPVLSTEDAADDPAIWVHPTDAQLSLVIGTDKQYGLEVYGQMGVGISESQLGLQTTSILDRCLAHGQQAPRF